MLAPTAGLLNWAVAHAGAGNPIGNLRVKEAADWLAANAGPLRGFTDDEVAQRGDKFAEHLASHGLFVAGSSGVQGEWPKVLLTRARRALFAVDNRAPRRTNRDPICLSDPACAVRTTEAASCVAECGVSITLATHAGHATSRPPFFRPCHG